jgi:acyl-CoA synthetase (NDP forming)
MTIEKWENVIRLIREGNIPVYDFAETAARTLSAMTRYGTVARRKPPTYKTYRHDKKTAKAIIKKHTGKGKFIGQDDVFRLLDCYGIPAVKTVGVKKETELGRAAKKIGFPLVLKVDAEAVVHKMDVGGVALGIKNEKALTAAFNKMAKKFAKEKPAFILQEFATGGREVIMGIKGNEGLAPTMMFGLGGIFVEAMKDVRFKLAPLSTADALDMIRSIKAFPILEGTRGEKAADIDKLAEILVRLAQLGSDFPEIEEMDLNPVLAFDKGKGASVVDARIKVR